MKTKLYAFWKHDQFPFVLGGEVTEMQGNGMVETVGYGKGSWFKPCLILPLKEGKEMHDKILEIGRQWHCEQYNLADRFNAKLRNGFPDLVHVLPKKRDDSH